jgi:hypothetical protein
VLKPLKQNFNCQDENDINLRSYTDNDILNFKEESYHDSFSCSKLNHDPDQDKAASLRKSASPFNPKKIQNAKLTLSTESDQEALVNKLIKFYSAQGTILDFVKKFA